MIKKDADKLQEKFDTSKVTDMCGLFSGAKTFNKSLGENFDTDPS